MNDKWKEICYLIRRHDGSKEDKLQLEIVNIFEKLGWTRFNGEIEEQRTLPVGAGKWLIPDIIIKNKVSDLFVVEVKRLAVKNTEGHRSQLCSYMRQLKLNVGLLINDSIHIFFDDESSKVPIEILNIEIKESDNNGDKFVEFFSKNSFSKEKIANFCINQSKKQDIVDLITADEYKDKILGFLKKDLATNFSNEAIEMALGMIEINISSSKDSLLPTTLSVVQANERNLTQPIISSTEVNGVEGSETDKIKNEIAKIEKRLPGWLNKPNQTNSRILITAMRHLMANDILSYAKLEKECKEISDFKASFLAMVYFGTKNNGKVFDFDRKNDSITLWPPVKEFIKEMYSIFIQKS